MRREELKETVKGYTLMVLKDYLETDGDVAAAMEELDGLFSEVTAEEARSYYRSQI